MYFFIQYFSLPGGFDVDEPALPRAASNMATRFTPKIAPNTRGELFIQNIFERAE
jgi:hypothetical protein